MNLGDKLAFSNGIVALSVAAGFLCVVFGGDPHALIPLHMIGVFLSFTLSQTGMFLRARRLREPGWRTAATISGIGGCVTFCVLIIVAITKGLDGAWIVVVLIPVLTLVFRTTRAHYDSVAAQLSGSHVKLVVLQSPYRSMSEPLLDYIDRLERENPDDYITVVLPEFVVKHWWHHLLHN